MTFNDAELAALEGGAQRIGVFFRLDTDPVVRLWLAFGKIRVGANAYDPSGAEYAGFGEIMDVPAFKQLLNGAAERVEFTLSGVSGDLMRIASGNDAQQVKGKRAAIGFGLFSQTWSTLLGEVHWCASYVADFLTVQQAVADQMDSIVRTISLSCGTRFTGRRRPQLSYFSDQDQQRRYAGDLFCSLVGRYAHGFQKPWPVFD